MGIHRMKYEKLRSKGFTLIASLLLLLLLSGIAIGLMMMVNTEGKVGGTDLQNNAAYHSAEGGIEKMTSDLAATFSNSQSPTAAQICNLSTMQPTMVGVTWKYYQVTPGNLGSACPTSLTGLTNWGQISSGPNQGLWAQIIPISMQATADEAGGQEVSMIRSAQVALIPVFQFGVFSESDLGFFNSPDLNFAGRVHTNADLYLGVANGYNLTFHDKMEAYGNVVTTVLPNGLSAASYNDTGNVYIPTADPGCSTTTTNCTTKAIAGSGNNYGDGSVQGAGGNPPQSTYNTNVWNNFSNTTTNDELINGNYGSTTNPGTGAKSLSMPFVNGTTFPYEIIRRPQATDTTALSQSREYNMAQIHVLLSDDPAALPGGASDANNVRLANVTGASPSNPYGIPTSVPTGLPALAAGSTYNMYFAQASNAIPNEASCNGTNCGPSNSDLTLPSDWTYAPSTPPTGAQTLVPTGAPLMSGSNTTAPPTINVCPPYNVSASNLPSGCSSTAITYPYTSTQGTTSTWNLIDGWLRVEYKDASGNWHPVTTEWLQLGFARSLVPPITAGGNIVNPNAILLLQEAADRGANGTIDPIGKPSVCTKVVSGVCTQWTNALPPEALEDTLNVTPWQFGVTNSSTSTQSLTRFNWYPINFYDAREGEPRDTDWGNNSCTTNGVMNAVEIDVGNLKRWLTGAIGTSGTSVDYIAQNGYVLYFSDERGMLNNPTKGYKTGDSGLEDVVNSSSSTGVPDGHLEAIPAGKTLSPEDVNQNGVLDEYGTANMGLGQYGANGVANKSQNSAIVAATPDNPYTPRITSCSTTARKNWVSGARHVLKLVDGALNNVPLRTDSGAPNTGGFTVASENPVYIQGNYNSDSTDTFFTQQTSAGPGPDVTGHSAAAVIADAVTVLSNNWNDTISTVGISGNTDVTYAQGPYAGNRVASTTYYRVAIAGGKNMAFPFPSWENSTDYGFGTDGGVHNFLRFLEDWNTSNATLNYGGSLVSLYYATYNTGLFKCCTYSVYSPPTRNYIFDSDFTAPSGLPPGTPMFKDVNSLGYRQLFTARTN
jgi:Tfp pilus assembly protein PilX